MKRSLLSILLFTVLPVGVWISWNFLLDPPLNPAYNTDVRRSLPIDMGQGNAAIGLMGLDAPADTEDFYKHGRLKASRRLHDYELIKQHHKIEPVLCSPSGDPMALFNPEETRQPLALKEMKTDLYALSCLSSVPQRTKEISACATEEALQQWVGENGTIWNRYNTLLTYKTFVPVPVDIDHSLYSGADLLILAKVKAADILINAKTDPGFAFNQWHQSMMLARHMVGSHTSIVEKAVFVIFLGQQLTTLEALLYAHPEMAVTYGSMIEEALKPQGVAIYKADTMLADEWQLIEPSVYNMLDKALKGENTGPVDRFISKHTKLVSHGFLNDVYDCVKEGSAIAALSADEYAARDGKPFCGDIFSDSPLMQGLMTPGNFATNVSLYLMASGSFRGADLVTQMHLQDAKMRMGILASRILSGKIPAAEIPAYLESAPEDLQSPYKSAQFQWDDAEKKIFFKPPVATQPVQDFYIRIDQEK